MIKPKDYDALSRRERSVLREQYVREQKGKCYFCGEPLVGNPSEKVMRAPIDNRLFPQGFFRYPVHLQHNHTTGMTEGAVHARCNAYLWQYLGR